METVLRGLTVIVLITEGRLDKVMLTLLLQRCDYLVYRGGTARTVSQLGALCTTSVMVCCKWRL